MDKQHAQSDPAQDPAQDPAVAALLDFTPVCRRTRRHDGWSPERQRDFIVALAGCGKVGPAAHSVGRTLSGAYKVRSAGDAEEFAAAWDAAVALFDARNPKPLRTALDPLPRPAPWRGRMPEPEPEPEEGDDEAFAATLLDRYIQKVQAEREARLEGRIVAADFLVRQLTVIEVMMDLAGAGVRILQWLKGSGGGPVEAIRVTATPMTILLDEARREIWRAADEPDRPPLAPLGTVDEEISFGLPGTLQPSECGGLEAAQRQETAQNHLRAEAQRAWEEKARADAAAWRAQVDEGGAKTEDDA